MSQVNVEDFINKHLVKVFYTLIVFFMYNMYIDFKEVKTTLQQMLINQATVEIRISNMEATTKQNSVDIQTLREYHNNKNKE